MKKEITIIITLIFLITAAIILIPNSKKENQEKPEIPDTGYENPKEENPSEEEPENEKREPAPQISIILDDLGNNFETDKSISAIKENLTLAILPKKASSTRTAEYFKNIEGFELMLHLPLEPLAEKDWEKDMIMTSMGRGEIKLKLEEYLSELGGYVKGINNHKGSKFTSDEEKMKILLEEMQDKNLFFVDSFTYKDSVAYSLAKQIGMKTAKRDIFLDNSNNKEEIRKMLREGVEIAKEEGSAILIGHSRENTISLLKEEIPKLKEEGIRFLKVSDLIKERNTIY